MVFGCRGIGVFYLCCFVIGMFSDCGGYGNCDDGDCE